MLQCLAWNPAPDQGLTAEACRPTVEAYKRRDETVPSTPPWMPASTRKRSRGLDTNSASRVTRPLPCPKISGPISARASPVLESCRAQTAPYPAAWRRSSETRYQIVDAVSWSQRSLHRRRLALGKAGAGEILTPSARQLYSAWPLGAGRMKRSLRPCPSIPSLGDEVARTKAPCMWSES